MTSLSPESRRADTVFWVETENIRPNPMQPRREFDEQKLKDLSESIRQYGVLQPLVVVRMEEEVPTGTKVFYELIAGERRLRAAKLGSVAQVPVIIRQDEPEKVKLELALVENVQREDLNPIERARAFRQLMDDFSLRQREIASRVGKSREFVANSVRLLSLPEDIQQSLIEGRITEGHTRPLLMLSDRPEEQKNLLSEIIYKHMSVRDAEKLSRKIAYDRARKKDYDIDPGVKKIEEELSQVFGTRVSIEKKGLGGKVSIEFFSQEDLSELLNKVKGSLPIYGEEIPEVMSASYQGQDTISRETSRDKFDELIEEGIKEVKEEGQFSSAASEEDLESFTI